MMYQMKNIIVLKITISSFLREGVWEEYNVGHCMQLILCLIWGNNGPESLLAYVTSIL